MGKETDEAKFIIEGDPGQNNTFIKIGTAYNVNPKATKVENTFIIGSRKEGEKAIGEAMGSMPPGKKLGEMTLREMLAQGLIDTGNIQKEIMNYVSCIRPYVKDENDKLYMKLWARILEHETFKTDLYDPGKQPCKFNRNLVANIFHYLDCKHFYKAEYNQSEMTRALEGDDQHAIRKALRFDPEEKYIKVIDEIIEKLEEE